MTGRPRSGCTGWRLAIVKVVRAGFKIWRWCLRIPPPPVYTPVQRELLRCFRTMSPGDVLLTGALIEAMASGEITGSEIDVALR